MLAVSERTKRDLIELYGIPEEKIVVTPNGVDPAFTPGGERDGYLLFVGAIQERKDPLAAIDAATEVGLPLVVAGPAKEPALARELERRGADLRGYVDKPQLAELYRGAACLVLPSRYEGFGLPVLEAMACGTPVVASRRARAARGRRRRGRLRRAAASFALRSPARLPSARRGRAPASRGRDCSRGTKPRGARSRPIVRCSGCDARFRSRGLARRRALTCASRCPRWRRRSTRSS